MKSTKPIVERTLEEKVSFVMHPSCSLLDSCQVYSVHSTDVLSFELFTGF